MIHCNKTCFQLAKRLALFVSLIVVSNAIHAGGFSHATHYSKATITTSNGLGKVIFQPFNLKINK